MNVLLSLGAESKRECCADLLQGRMAAERAGTGCSAGSQINLVDLLHQTPRLTQILLQNGASAVSFSGSCKAARTIIHENVSAIKVIEHNGYGLQYQVEAMKTLITSNYPHLQKLDIKYRAKLQFDAVCILSQANWPLLTELNLSRNNLEAAAVGHLIQGRWPKLRALNLSHNLLGPMGMQWLNRGDWPSLESLDLSDTGINADASDELAKGRWSQLRHVAISYNMLSLAEMEPLLKAPWAALTSLDLSHNRLSAAALAILTQMSLPGLRRLVLSHNLFSPMASKQLQEGHWPHLEHLDVALCCMHKFWLGVWPNLRWLSLQGNLLCNLPETIPVIAKQLPMLSVLSLSDTDLSVEDVDMLVGRVPYGMYWAELKEIYLSQNQLDAYSLGLLAVACGMYLSPGKNTIHTSPEPLSCPWPQLQLIEI